MGSLGTAIVGRHLPTGGQLGRVVRQIRLEREMTLEAMAKAANLHWTYLSGIERGRRNPTLHVLTEIARSLEVKTSDLIRLAEDADD